MATRMQQRRGTASQWTNANPILNAGEIGFESDNNRFKIGDGINHWDDLTYFSDNAALSDLIDGAPDLLNTLNELAAAVGDDPAFFTTVATNLSNHQSDSTNIHGITDTAELATKSFAASLLTGATKSNITITGDKNGLTISAENGVADSTTDNLTEGSTNKYFTDERAQDAVGNAIGTGLTYTDSTGAIAVDTTAIQARVADVSDTEIGYLNGVSSAIQTQIDSKLSTSTASSTYQPLVSGISDTEIGYLDGVTSAIQTQLNDKQPKVSGVSDTEIGYLDGVTSAIQTQLDAKLPKSGGTMTGDILMGTNKVTGLGAPTADADAATKAYVDAATAGLNVHESVKAATTANITLATAVENGDTLDGVTLATGNRILIKNQTTKSENGIYVVEASGAPSRAADYNTTPEVDAGDFVFVEGGTTNGKTGWIQTNNVATIGSSDIEFSQFSGVGTYSAGNGLTLTGNTFTIDTSITQARVSGVSDTEIGYLDGVTSAIQTQLDAKVATSSLGTGVATFLGTPTSANLASAVTGETGSGALVFGSSPTLKGPVYFQSGGGAGGSANYIDVNNSTGKVSVVSGYPMDLTATGDIVLTASTGAVKVGSDTVVTLAASQTLTNKTLTSPTLTTPALGTPASGVMTNVTGLPLTTGVTGTLPIANGGTGATTASTAAAALLPSQSSNSGKYLTTDGSGTLSWGTVTGYSAPTLGSTSISSGATVTTITGLTENNLTLTGTLTAGSAAGTSGQVLSSTGTGVQWITPSQGAAFSELMLVGC